MSAYPSPKPTHTPLPFRTAGLSCGTDVYVETVRNNDVARLRQLVPMLDAP